MNTNLLILGLAAFRVASLLVIEDGPWDVFKELRYQVGRPGVPRVIRAFLMGVLSCTWCCSLWAAAGLWAVNEYVSSAPLVILAAGTIAMMVSEAVTWVAKRH